MVHFVHFTTIGSAPLSPVMQALTVQGDSVLSSRSDAYELLDSLEAPEQLKIHVQLVGEAADL